MNEQQSAITVLRPARHAITVSAAFLLAALLPFLHACSDSSAPPVETLTPVTIAPPGFPVMEIPADNPLTEEGIALGRQLFFDPILSGDSTQACGHCHLPELAFSNGIRFSEGIDRIAGTRNAPTIINAGWLRSLFWDGRARTLEEQALEPVPNPIEMHQPWPGAVAKVQNHPDYPSLFGKVFGTDVITRDLIVKAIAQFERTFVSNRSNFDRFVRGERALTDEEQRGFNIFFTEVGDCFHCHGNILGTDNLFHDIGLDAVPSDNGLGDVTGLPSDHGKFKTPTLRNVELTGPYMHDGRFQTLEDVIGHYNSGGFGSPNVDPLIRVGAGLGLTGAQVQDVVAFLKTFTDTSFVNNPALRNPFD